MHAAPLAILRSLFLLGCLLPTLAVAGWQAARHWPGRQAAMLESLSTRLGWELRCAGMERTPDGRLIFDQLEAADPESGARIWRCRRLEALATPEGWVLLASQPEVEAERLDLLWRMAAERLLRSGAGQIPFCRVTCQELTLAHPVQAQTLLEVEAEWTPAHDRPRAWVAFRLAGYELPSAVRLTATRDRTAEPAVTRVELHTGSSQLPCSLAAGVWPEVRRLGEDAWFQGSIWLEPSRRPVAPRGAPLLAGEGWDGEIAGHFTEIDLRRLLAEPYHPHRVSGRVGATLTARVEDGRLVAAGGSVTHTPGGEPLVIGRSLVEGAERGLRIIPVSRGKEGETLVATRLACEFQLSEEGLVLKGSLPNAPPGTLLADAEGPLLSEPTYARAPIVGLVQTLVGGGGEPVPATREAASLLRLLPIPRAVRAAEEPTRVWLED